MLTATTTHDFQEFVNGLTYDEDQRQPPDPRRRGQFQAGWNRVARRKPMSQDVLVSRLTWNNLGYRLGVEFGPASRATITDVFEVFADLYRSANT